MLGHYSVRADNEQLAALQADYDKTIAQVYVDVAVRVLTGDSSLITLAAVQHPKLPSGTKAPNQASAQTRTVDEKTLPSWCRTGRLTKHTFSPSQSAHTMLMVRHPLR